MPMTLHHAPPWLKRMPRLMSAWLAWRNGRRRGSPRGALWATASVAALAAEAALLAWLGGGVQHPLLIGAVAGIATLMTVARRRATTSAAAPRSWVSALPIQRAFGRVEILFINHAPTIGLLLSMNLAYALDRLFALAPHSFASVCVPINTGVAAGALLSHLVPTPKAVDLPPGSRYVPKRRAAARATVPRLAALGIWPVRQMFASARPKVVAQATIPVMVMMPLGTMADAAMVVLALFAVSGGLALLFAAVLAVSRTAWRWLAPLPMRPGSLARALLLRPTVLFVGGVAIDAWLLWLLGVK